MITPRQTGFTLIELLVAITLMALVSLIAWRGLESIAQLRERLTDDAGQTDAIMRLLGQLERDIAMRASDVVLEAALEQPHLPSEQQKLRSLPLALSVPASKTPGSTLRLEIIRAAGTTAGLWQRVVWWRENNALYRAAGAPSNQYPLPDPGTGTMVMTDVAALSINGWVPQSGWVPLPRPADANTPVTGLEVAIRRHRDDGPETYSRVLILQ